MTTPTTATTSEALTYGVEIETYGLTNGEAARVVAAALGGAVDNGGGFYDKVYAVAPDGRKWTAMYDGSIRGGGSEVVSPILKGADDLATLQVVVRALRAAGAKSDAAHQCGIHVHVGMQTLDAAAIGRVVRTVAKYDAFIRTAAGVDGERGRDWCCPLTTPTRQSGHVANIPALARARTMTALGAAWYGDEHAARSAAHDHYHGSRYHGLNLHSLFYAARGTVEFRYFNGTLHAGQVKAYVQMCLALVVKAANAGAVSGRLMAPRDSTEARFVLYRLGLRGDEFKTARALLSAAWPARQTAATVAA